MQLIITMKSDHAVSIPIHYNYLLQGLIYKNISPGLAKFLHEHGFMYEKRSFKLFTFSRLLGRVKYQKEDKSLIVDNGPIKLVISTPLEKFCYELANTLMLTNNILIGKESLEIDNISFSDPQPEGDEMFVNTFSSVVTYSTLQRMEGGKYTCYHHPDEKDFKKQIQENLRKKHYILFGKESNAKNLRIFKRSKARRRILKYKNFIIKGYDGRFHMQGPKDLLKLALDCGIGSKNSQGFGCLELAGGKIN